MRIVNSTIKFDFELTSRVTLGLEDYLGNRYFIIQKYFFDDITDRHFQRNENNFADPIYNVINYEKLFDVKGVIERM